MLLAPATAFEREGVQGIMDHKVLSVVKVLININPVADVKGS